MQTEAQKRATANYRKKMKHVTVAFSPGEKELYEFLAMHENRAGYIKELIRRDMEKAR